MFPDNMEGMRLEMDLFASAKTFAGPCTGTAGRLSFVGTLDKIEEICLLWPGFSLL